MMADQPNLVTTCSFKGREFVVKMNVSNGNILELSATDKFSAEEWNCSYDATYVENQTRKTGNFKHFEVFVSMLKSGLLKSSDCVSLDLLTFEDLELLRSRRIMGRSSRSTSRTASSNNLLINVNRRYLILTYAVEFDRVHYPLPLEYCGPPDPQVLQAVIRRLEAEVSKLHEQLAAAPRNVATNDKIKFLEHKVDQLMIENRKLSADAQQAKRSKSKIAVSDRQLEELQKQCRDLEESAVIERRSYHRVVARLREEKAALTRHIHVLEESVQGKGSRADVCSFQSQNPNIPEPGVKWSTSKIALEQARLEEMRASLKKFSSKTNSSNKPASACHSSETICPATKISTNIRYRSCSGSSMGSTKRSRARACHSSPLTETMLRRGAQPRGRCRSRRDTSASSAGSRAFPAPQSRHSSVSSLASSKSGRSDTQLGDVGKSVGPRRISRKCTNNKIKTVQDLELRIKNLQKRLAESEPA